MTTPLRAARWWVALMSMPTAIRCGPACSTDPNEPSVSARTTDAPPCSSPYGWVLPSTGIVATSRSVPTSVKTMPIRSIRVPRAIALARSRGLSPSVLVMPGS